MRRVPVFLIAVVALVVATGAVIAMPAVRAQVAKWLGFGVEQQETLPPWIARVLGRAPWEMPPDKKWFEMYTIEFPQARWEAVAQAEAQGLAVPEPGSRISLADGSALPIPGYLPEGYRWQGVTCLQSDTQKAVAPSLGHQGSLLSLGSRSATGGSPADSHNPHPPYDANVSNYLIGGDRADHLLMLAQFEGDAPEEVLFQAYHVVAPDRQPANGAAAAAVPSDSALTPTPVASYYQAKIQVGVVVRPATDQKRLVFLVGPCELHETTVGGVQGLWYRGTWNAAGQWVDDRTTSLIWQHEGLTYQLTGQEVTLADLVRIAESMPS
ncbi:MAG TPA: hypothetical protein PLG21_14995 [Anaerolineae bacterium]|nr:hypothetical protein [Anaerolineae bacterium]